MSRDHWREAQQTTHHVGPWPEPSVRREHVVNQRRPWLIRLRRRQPNLVPTLLLTVLYLAGAVHLALQHCRLTSLLCLLAAVATITVSRRHANTPANSRSPFTPSLR